MNFFTHSLSLVAALTLLGCGGSDETDAEKSPRELEREANPTFMFFNYRREIVSDEFSVPAMKSEAAAEHINRQLKTIPGFVKSEHDLARNTITVTYESSSSRKMNFEEAIALAGFAVNNRPTKARPSAGAQ